MFFTLFPRHLILFILDEWLCSWNDLSSLDLALTNKELRFYFYEDSIEKINSEITIIIKNGKKLASLIEWKEKRQLEITKLCLDHLIEYDLSEYSIKNIHNIQNNRR